MDKQKLMNYLYAKRNASVNGITITFNKERQVICRATIVCLEQIIEAIKEGKFD